MTPRPSSSRRPREPHRGPASNHHRSTLHRSSYPRRLLLEPHDDQRLAALLPAFDIPFLTAAAIPTRSRRPGAYRCRRPSAA
ncbi:hypothetical protein [Nannocystis pusilla]|uniref:hypothetical protein n=1 Tax=Nannocystis pusilla TaxID=889268 RepID=UPI003B7A26D6